MSGAAADPSSRKIAAELTGDGPGGSEMTPALAALRCCSSSSPWAAGGLSAAKAGAIGLALALALALLAPGLRLDGALAPQLAGSAARGPGFPP